MEEKLLLLHGSGSCGCQDKNLGGSQMPYNKRYNKATRRYAKRRSSRPKFMLGSMGAGEGLKASFAAVKGVLITGLIAAGGAVVTRKIFDAYGAKVNLTKGSTEESLAIGAVGIAGGIMIAKFFKKPDIGAAFAIGTLVLAGINILGTVLGTPATAGLGYIVAERPGFQSAKMAALAASRVEEPGFHPQVVPAMAGYGHY